MTFVEQGPPRGNPKNRWTQCKLIHRHDGRVGIDVAWIEHDIAKKGNILTFRDEPGTFEVAEVWGTKPEPEVFAMERVYRDQRKASDVRRGGRGHMEY